MFRLINLFLFCSLIGQQIAGYAQPAMQTSGALIIVPADGEVRHANDEARITFMIEEHDRDKAAAASRVNQKMKQGTDIVRREDPTALLKTRGYYTYPVYADDQPRQGGKPRPPVSWRVGQYLEVTTTNLSHLAKTVAEAQRILALNGLQFGLTEATRRKMDEQRIAVAYKNLTDRIAAIAKAMGRHVSDATIDTVDFEASGNYVPKDAAASAFSVRSSGMPELALVEEPSFEPGETILEVRVVAKIKLK